MSSLSASVAKIAAPTFASRLLGFARDMLVARLFGADGGTDAFFVAFKVPNLLRRLFAEGAFAMALVPVLNEYRQQRGLPEVKDLVDDVAGTLAVLVLAVTAAGVLAAPLLVLLVAPGFADDPERAALTTDMLRLTLPYLAFISLTALAGAVLNTYERFGVPAAVPLLLNLTLIGAALWLAPLLERPIMALAWGVLVAGIVQLAFMLPFLARLGLLPRPRWRPAADGVRRIGRLMVPALFGTSVVQLGLLLDTLLASFLEAGSISWLYYSDRLMEFPLGILGAALGSAILPRLSREHLARSAEAFSATLDWALRWVLLFGLPAAVGLFVLAGPIVATLFQSDAFDARDVVMAERSLMAYALGLVALLGIKVLAPGFYSRQDARRPMRIAALALVANLLLSLALMVPLGHAGLALGTALAAVLNAVLLFHGLRRRGLYRPQRGWRRLALAGLVASAAMGATLWLLGGATADWTAPDAAGRLWRLFALIGAGGLVYGLVALALGVRARHILSANAT